MNPKQRKVVRGWREQLLTLVNGWDPVGLLAAGAPRNEYDCIVDELLGILSRQSSVEEVTAFLESEISEHFGMDAKGADQFARKAVNWFRLASSEQ